MIVMKFGGTSVRDADAMNYVLDIIKSKKKKKVFVVSSACSGITNQLIDLSENALGRTLDTNGKIVEEISERHLTVIDELVRNPKNKEIAKSEIRNVIKKLAEHVEAVKLLNECTDRSKAHILSFGEMLSTTVIYNALNDRNIKVHFADIRKSFKSDSNYLEASLDFKKTNTNLKRLSRKYSKVDIIISQGFIASDSDGNTTTLGRGGSDYSAAVIGAVLKADEIQIWTDVSGVLTADPRKVLDAVTIPRMTFDEIRELSFYGAKVLHPDTIKPAVQSNIPVRVLNTFQPKDKGTLLVTKPVTKKSVIRSVITKTDCLEYKIEIPAEEDSNIYFANLLKRFENKNIKALYSLSTKKNCRIVVDANSITDEEEKYVFGPYDVNPESCGLLCIGGVNIDKYVKNKEFAELTKILGQFEVKNLLYGISDVSILALFNPKEEKKILSSLHKLVIKELG